MPALVFAVVQLKSVCSEAWFPDLGVPTPHTDFWIAYKRDSTSTKKLNCEPRIGSLPQHGPLPPLLTLRNVLCLPAHPGCFRDAKAWEATWRTKPERDLVEDRAHLHK